MPSGPQQQPPASGINKINANRKCQEEQVFEKGWHQGKHKGPHIRQLTEKLILLKVLLQHHNLLAGLCSGRFICSDATGRGLNSSKKF